MLTSLGSLFLASALAVRADDGPAGLVPPPPIKGPAAIVPDLEPPPPLLPPGGKPSGPPRKAPVIPAPPKRESYFPSYLPAVQDAVEKAAVAAAAAGRGKEYGLGPDGKAPGHTELQEAARRDFKALFEAFEFFNAFAIENMAVEPPGVCSVPEEFWKAYRQHYADMGALENHLKSRFPLGWAVMSSAGHYEYQLERIPELRTQAAVQAPRFVEARSHCRYAAEGLAGTPAGRAALAKAGSPFSGKGGPSGTELNRTFDGSETVPGAGDSDREPPPPSAEPGSAAPPEAGLKTSAVPLDSFESLTRGLAFDGPDEVPGFLGIMKANPAKKAYEEALRHLYSIPAGREVLRDVNAMLGRTEEMMAKMRDKFEASHAESAAELARLKADPASDPEKTKELEVELQWMREHLLPALTSGVRPRVTVSFKETPHRVGGYASSNYHIAALEPGGKTTMTLPVVLAPDILKDNNPGRAVDKLLSHELRHSADVGLLEHDYRRGAQWLLVEDRAFLQEARATLEQREAMRKEPPSAFVQGMYDGDVTPMLRDPVSARNALMKRPNYVWHVTPADFKDPESSLRSRLGTVYRVLAAARSSELADEVKTLERPGGGLGEAFRVARAEARRKGDFYAEEARFIELASASEAGKAWLKAVTSLASDFNADTPEGRAKREKYKQMEREYFSGLGALAAGGESAR